MKMMNMIQLQACRSFSSQCLLLSLQESMSIGLDLDEQTDLEDGENEDEDS